MEKYLLFNYDLIPTSSKTTHDDKDDCTEIILN